MSEYQRETAFLRRCLSYHDSPESRKLDECLTQLLRNQDCVRRAMELMVIIAGLAVVGLSGAAIYLNDYSNGFSQSFTQIAVRCLCVLGAGAFLSLLAFAAVGIFYRLEMNEWRDECRVLITTLIESRCGKPAPDCTESMRSSTVVNFR